MSDAGLKILTQDGSGDHLRAEILVTAGGPWFEDHFPDTPVLPAIAHFDLICRVHRAAGGAGRIAALDRVRLTSPVRPGDRLELTLERLTAEVSRFTLRGADGRAVSDGRVSWARGEEPHE